MLRSPTVGVSDSRDAARPNGRLLGVGGILLVVLLLPVVALAGATTILTAAPRGLTVEVPGDGLDVPPDATLRATVTGWHASLDEARLFESAVGPDGRAGVERDVSLQVQIARATWGPEGSDLTLRPAQPLRPEATYRLHLRGSALAPTAAGPYAELEREVRFTTVRGPRAQVPLSPTRLKWGEPLRVAWDAPVDDVRYAVSPSTAVRSWVDPNDRRRSLLQIDEPADGTTYRVTIEGARGVNGVESRQPVAVQIQFPPRPRLLEPEETRTLEDGKPLTLRWSTPIDRVAIESDPPIGIAWQVDRRDPSVVDVRLDGPAQGTTYALTVVEAVSREGAPLDGQPTVEARTPDALAVEELDLGEDGPRATVKARPVLTFSQPIRDRRLAQAAISIDPPIAGRWEWLDDRRVRFAPLRPLPYDTEITFKVKPGRDGVRSQAGSYVEEPATFALVTETDKVIDVDVTRQVMTLMQQGRTVRTLNVATGVPGADTPLGEFAVQYKMPVARFRGVNVNGSRYDIPDVKWVLAFMGDYTIHGAYWRSSFGAPGSNGCVSLTDADAKLVFDWAPEGTRVKIHY